MNTFLSRHVALCTTALLTALYFFLLSLNPAGGGNDFSFAWDLPSSFVGMFVPVAVWITAMTFFTAPVLLLYICYSLDKSFEKNYLSTAKRILYTIAILFILTICIDLVITMIIGDMKPVSILYFLNYLGIIEFSM